MEQLEKQDRTIRKLKKQLKVYSKRIGEMGGVGEFISRRKPVYMCVWVLEFRMLPDCRDLVFLPAGQTEGQTSPGQMVDEPIHPVNIPRREKDFQGMLEYKKEDELKLVKNLILGKNSQQTGGKPLVDPQTSIKRLLKDLLGLLWLQNGKPLTPKFHRAQLQPLELVATILNSEFINHL